MDAERCKTHLGTKIEIKNEARNRWMHRVVFGNRGLPLTVRALKADEKNMGAIPMAGTGLALMMPHGSSRATAGTKEQIATMRRARYWSAC